MALLDANWPRDFGIEPSGQPEFFRSMADLDARDKIPPYAHVVRRAFRDLGLDGVLCEASGPIAYFKALKQIDLTNLSSLHRRFWNHGGAPLLIIVSSTDVYLYSSFERPSAETGNENGLAGQIEKIARSSPNLRDLLPSISSGEFFRRHSRSFKMDDRIDQVLLNNLQATRERLAAVPGKKASTEVLDAILCRLVFTCYLFDRGVVGSDYLKSAGIPKTSHLRDVLKIEPRSEAKSALYKLFRKLAIDFNGDLFSDDLAEEAKLIYVEHIDRIESFFRGDDVIKGQRAFWPYDFSAIPIETISAIYERFLKSADLEKGAFYTPRFLAELVLDVALAGTPSLLGLRYLDPACGSGIFLVGIFNRIAEEWKRANPGARNEVRARELANILATNLFGIDVSRTACRIAAFSLYLAYLDQLSPRDIQRLQAKKRALPPLVKDAGTRDQSLVGGIRFANFFGGEIPASMHADFVIGNPPWGGSAAKDPDARDWLAKSNQKIADNQIASAFMLKCTTHVAPKGKVCLVLPHGTLFNHNPPAVEFQKSFLKSYAVDLVLNLADFQSFLFRNARHPALVVRYSNRKPVPGHLIDYWAPKIDWKSLRTEVVVISGSDRSSLPLKSILENLESYDAPQIWKRMSWASARDRRLLDRLSSFPRLASKVRQISDVTPADNGTAPTDEASANRTWLIAEGFQPLGKNDDVEKSKFVTLPSNLFIQAKDKNLNLFLLPEDCEERSETVELRGRSNSVTKIFEPPHVIVSKGFGSVAYADFAVSFQHALRGINAPEGDRDLLIFLAGYLRSPLAKYFAFHVSSNWGVSRSEVHVRELLHLPFPMPNELSDTSNGKRIVADVVRIVTTAADKGKGFFANRLELVEAAQEKIDELIYEYFDVIDVERILVRDTVEILIDSFRPGPQRQSVPAIAAAPTSALSSYAARLCNTLDLWSGREGSVSAGINVSRASGTAMVTLVYQTKEHGNALPVESSGDSDLLVKSLTALRDAASIKMNTFELAKGIKFFDGPRLHILKPLDLRHWTETSALNDADEIAEAIFSQDVGATA